MVSERSPVGRRHPRVGTSLLYVDHRLGTGMNIHPLQGSKSPDSEAVSVSGSSLVD